MWPGIAGESCRGLSVQFLQLTIFKVESYNKESDLIDSQMQNLQSLRKCKPLISLPPSHPAVDFGTHPPRGAPEAVARPRPDPASPDPASPVMKTKAVPHTHGTARRVGLLPTREACPGVTGTWGPEPGQAIKEKRGGRKRNSSCEPRP